jgi:hypothetical protein
MLDMMEGLPPFFLEVDESGMTAGLLKVLQVCKLIYWVARVPTID